MDATLFQAWIGEKLWMLALLGAFAVIDMILGVIMSATNGEFKLEKLPEFIITFVKWTAAWFALELVQFLPAMFNVDLSQYGVVADMFAQYSGALAYGGAVVKYIFSIFGHVNSSGVLPARANNALTKIGIPPASKG